jgi:hypothetical protein
MAVLFPALHPGHCHAGWAAIVSASCTVSGRSPPGAQAGQHRVQQRPRIVFPQALDHELRHACRMGRAAGAPQRPGQSILLPGGAPRTPAPARRRDRAIAGHRPRRSATAPRLLRTAAQHGQTDEEPVRGGPGAEAERGLQRLTLRTRQPAQAIRQRLAQLLQTGERHPTSDWTPGHGRPGSPARAGQGSPVAPACPSRLADQHQLLALARPESIDSRFTAPHRVPGGGRRHHLTGAGLTNQLTSKGRLAIWRMRVRPARRQPFITRHLLQARSRAAPTTRSLRTTGRNSPMPRARTASARLT